MSGERPYRSAYRIEVRDPNHTRCQKRNGTEVDFLLRRASEHLELIQVTQNLAALKTREREIRALQQAAAELNVRNLTVVTLDTEEIIESGGPPVNVVPCWKWLVLA